jgi:hypothetical protein
MIIAGFLGEDTLPAAAAAASIPAAAPAAAPAAPVVPAVAAPIAPTPSRATRDPFMRPVQATPNYVPRSLDTGFVHEFQPFPTIMLPQMPRIPLGIRSPLAAEPQSGGVPTATGMTALPADPSGQASIPAGVPSPVKGSMGRMFPPGLIMALGIMPSVRGVRSGRVSPTGLVASGRKPGSL